MLTCAWTCPAAAVGWRRAGEGDHLSPGAERWSRYLGSSFVSLIVQVAECLAFQVYLALSLEYVASPAAAWDVGVTALFAVSELFAIATQMRITAWRRNCWGSGGASWWGLSLMATRSSHR